MYSSIATSDLNDAEMQTLLGVCRALNSRVGITGVLLHLHAPQPGQAYFVQVLEGPQAAVQQTYTKILADELHHHVTLLSTGFIATREFGSWSMELRELDCEQTEALLQSLADDPSAPASTRAPTLSVAEWITRPVAMNLLIAEAA